MIQAKFFDCYEGYVADLDYDVIYANFDGAIPRAGCGYHKDKIVESVLAEFEKTGFPRHTYRIMGRPKYCGMSIENQCDQWLSIPGVLEATCDIDIEPAIQGRIETMIVYDELLETIEFLEKYHPLKPWWYSNEQYIAKLSYPAKLKEYPLWAAQWYWEPWKFREYLSYDAFLRDHAGESPRWVNKSIYRSACVGWQFTAHGRTPNICKTLAKRDHDFSVSTIEKSDFMAQFWPGNVPPPPPVVNTFDVYFSYVVNVRDAPAGNYVGDIYGTVKVKEETVEKFFGYKVFEWAEIVKPLNHAGRWVAIDNATRI